MSHVVEHHPDSNRYELHVDGELAGWVDLRPAGDSVIVAHTEIDEAREGEGLGSILVRGVLDDLRERGKTVLPMCPFTAAYIERHREYVDLVDPSMRSRLQ